MLNICLYKGIIVCLCNNTTANKTIFVSNEVATCQNITVKISRPGFKSSA